VLDGQEFPYAISAAGLGAEMARDAAPQITLTLLGATVRWRDELLLDPEKPPLEPPAEPMPGWPRPPIPM
jgi:hypothetical protein